MERYIPYSWIGKIILLRLPKAIYRFSTISIKTNDISYRTITNNSKICIGTQKTPNSQNNLQKEQRCNYHAP